MATLAEMRAAAAAKTAALNKENQIEDTPKETGNVVVSEGKDIRYFCKIAGMRFIFEDGIEAYFHYGRLDVGPATFPDTWRQYQRELNKILGKQTNIFLPEILPEVAPQVAQNAKSEAEIAAAEQAMAGLNTKTQQDQSGLGTSGAPTDVNQSTVDPALRAAMMGAAITLEGAAQAAANATAGAANSAS